MQKVLTVLAAVCWTIIVVVGFLVWQWSSGGWPFTPGWQRSTHGDGVFLQPLHNPVEQ